MGNAQKRARLRLAVKRALSRPPRIHRMSLDERQEEYEHRPRLKSPTTRHDQRRPIGESVTRICTSAGPARWSALVTPASRARWHIRSVTGDKKTSYSVSWQTRRRIEMTDHTSTLQLTRPLVRIGVETTGTGPAKSRIAKIAILRIEPTGVRRTTFGDGIPERLLA